jgi:EmrB/QacA subfamily drug resistance transporter
VKPVFVLAAMTASLAMVFVDQTVVSVALPTIRADLGLSSGEFQWVVNGYLLAVAGLAITLGRVSDQLGHPRGAAIAMAAFAAGSLLAGAAQSPEWLIAARLLQGAGGGMLTASTVAIVSDAYPQEHRGKALGLYWGIAGLALSLGPLLGGLITDSLGWRWIFYINPLIALAIAPVLIGLIRESPSRERGGLRLDVPGAVLLAVALAALIIGVQEVTVPLIAAGLVLLAVLVAVERRRANPVLELDFFRERVTVSAFLVVALTQPVLIWGAVYFSDFLQTSLAYDAGKTGFALLPVTVSLLLGSILGGRLTDRFGPRRPAIAGLAVVVASLAWLAIVVEENEYAVLVPGFFLLGLGLQVGQSPMATAVMNFVGDARRAVASGMLGTCRQIGGTIGFAALSAVVIAGSSLDDGMRVALIVEAVLAAIALAAVSFLLPARADRPSPPAGPPPSGSAPAGAPGPRPGPS